MKKGFSVMIAVALTLGIILTFVIVPAVSVNAEDRYGAVVKKYSAEFENFTINNPVATTAIVGDNETVNHDGGGALQSFAGTCLQIFQNLKAGDFTVMFDDINWEEFTKMLESQE